MACPSGHVEGDESQAQAAIREVEEETGLRGVRLLEPPAPALPAGFPATTSRVPLPWWITEMMVPADNHLAQEHIYVDHAWVGLAPTRIRRISLHIGLAGIPQRRSESCRCSRTHGCSPRRCLPAWRISLRDWGNHVSAGGWIG